MNHEIEVRNCAKRFLATNSETKIKKFSKRLKLMEAFVAKSGNKPEWMVMTFFLFAT
jgi:DNA-directed RNA polymerase subunit beta'